MDYKKLIKNRNIRIKIMQLLSFVPDEWMVRLQYRIKLGRKLNLKNPQRYTEKLQWYKLYYRNPLMAKCSDKYEVRDYVRECGLESILNDLYGIYEKPDEIDFDALPNQFVIKDTLGGGGNSVIIVTDKATMNKTDVMNKLEQWVSEPINKKHPGREWVYDGKKHRIIIEKMLMVDEGADLPDYKFFCFGGQVHCLYHMRNYTFNHANGEMGFFDKDFNLLPVRRNDFKNIDIQPKKPMNYEKMVGYAELLSAKFPHARVDMYDLEGKIVFGEITFFNASGYCSFEPDEFDYNLGEAFKSTKFCGL
ncbi:MAG: carbonic anhydrase [Lachnospiraceae bacterium]|nr:carbonic anhydrase [Lachnospiraceae bacterium]